MSVHETTDQSDAALVSSLLEGNGIPAYIENEHASLLVMGFPTPAIPLRVRVPAEDAADAREILKDRIRPPSEKPPQAFKSPNRKWLIAAMVLAPCLAAGELAGTGTRPSVGAGIAWAVLALGLLLDFKHRRPGVEFPEGRIAFFVLLGAIVPVGILELVQVRLTHLMGVTVGSPRYMFAVVGPLEEAAKFIPVYVLLKLRPAWSRDPFAWVIAAAASGVGFGMVENIMKFEVYRWAEWAITLSGLLHPLFSGFVGYVAVRTSGFYGIERGAIIGWMMASVLHGFWNSLCIEEMSWIGWIAAALFAWWYIRRADSWSKASLAGES